MARTPQEDMSFRPGAMSEESEFVLTEAYREISNLNSEVEKIKTQGTDKIEEDVRDLKKELCKAILNIESMSDEIKELKQSLSVNENAKNKIEVSLIALAAKMDADAVAQNAAVTNSQLDVDNESSTKTTIYGN